MINKNLFLDNLNEIKQMLTVDIEDLNKFGNLHKYKAKCVLPGYWY